MRPFFMFFGAKWRLAKALGPPRYDHVIEPFAGSAGYSVYCAPQRVKRVTLVEADPMLIGIWDYLQQASRKDILRLPSNISNLNQLPSSVCQQERDLIGLCMNRAQTAPALRRSNWARQGGAHASFWSETLKQRIVSQLEHIRHWTIIEGDWREAPDVKAHWHIDPPYQRAGISYRYNNVDYAALAVWCRSRKGFVQVCENEDADWLPFEWYADNRNTAHRVSGEAVFELENR